MLYRIFFDLFDFFFQNLNYFQKIKQTNFTKIRSIRAEIFSAKSDLGQSKRHAKKIFAEFAEFFSADSYRPKGRRLSAAAAATAAVKII